MDGKISLSKYVQDRDNVVLFWTAVGTPLGDYTPLGHPDFDFADRRGLLSLHGNVDRYGDWRWDGKGGPTDDRANSILNLIAYTDTEKWLSMVDE